LDTYRRKVDHTALKVNQGVIIAALLVAFVINIPWVVAGVALVMLVGTAIGRPGFFFINTLILRPLRIVKPDPLEDNPEPHRFAQGFGGVVAALSSLLLLLGGSSGGALVGGWALTWLVIVLAALNLFAGFCVGCAVYYWLNRLSIPGFSRTPPQGTFPGMRPRAQ
jgi:hypothetical protein